MAAIFLNLPEDLSNALNDLAKTNGLSANYLAVDVLRDYIEHEKTLTTQIELAVKEADQGKFATDDQVAAMRARRWRPHWRSTCSTSMPRWTHTNSCSASWS